MNQHQLEKKSVADSIAKDALPVPVSSTNATNTSASSHSLEDMDISVARGSDRLMVPHEVAHIVQQYRGRKPEVEM